MQPVLACESESLEKSESLSCAGLTQANGHGHHGAYVCSFLWPVVTHQSTDPAWENMTDRLSCRTAASSICLSPTHLAATALSCWRESAGEPGRDNSAVAETEGGSGWQTWWMFVMLLVAFFNIPWEGFEYVNLTVLLTFSCGYLQGTNQEPPMLQWYYCGVICMHCKYWPANGMVLGMAMQLHSSEGELWLKFLFFNALVYD